MTIKKHMKIAFLLLLIVSAFVFNIVAQAVYVIEQTPYGFSVKREVITLSNGTTAYKWISGEYSSTQKKELTKEVMNSYNIIQELYAGQPTVKYNCHSYAWYSQAINNQYWIDNPQKFREGNWLKSTGWTNVIPSGINAGDIVDYYITETNRPHSAVVASLLNNWVTSKWGTLGLYMHSLTEVPAIYKCNDFGYYRIR